MTVAPVFTPGLEYRVEVGVGSGFTDADYFYDEAARTVYDSALYSAGEIQWTEVTTRGISFTTNRGRDTLKDTFRAGTISVLLNNEDGLFNPDYAGAALGIQSLRPGRYMRVSARVAGDTEWLVLGVGEIESINENYASAGFRTTTTLRAIDGMSRLNLDNPPALTEAVPAERSDNRIRTILEAFGYQGPTDQFDVGKYQMQSSTLAGSRLQECNITAQSEGGAFYFDREGLAQFRNRDWLEEGDRESTPQYLVGFEVAGFNPGFVEILDVSTDWSLSRVRNDIQFARRGGSAQRVQDTQSIGIYGQRSHRQFDFENSADPAVYALAERYLERYAYDRARLQKLRVYPVTADAARALLATDVGWRLRVRVGVNGLTPDFWAYTTDVWVQRIVHVGTPSDYYAELVVDNVNTGNPFVGGPFSLGFDTGFNVNNADQLGARTWAAEYPSTPIEAGWYSQALGDAQVSESFTVTALVDWYDRSAGQRVIAGVWPTANAERSYRVRLVNPEIRFESRSAAGAIQSAWTVPAEFPAGVPFWLRIDYDNDAGTARLWTAPRSSSPQWVDQGAVPANAPMLAAAVSPVYIATDIGTGTPRENANVRLWEVAYFGADGERRWRWTADKQAAINPGAEVPTAFDAWLYAGITGDPDLISSP